MARSRRDEDELAGWALTLAFIIAVFFLISSRTEARQGQATPVLADQVVSPLATVLSKPIRSIEQFVFGFQDRARAHEENRVLRQELAILREQQATLEAMQYKLQRYEAMIGSNAGTAIPLEKIAARAVSESSGPFAQSILLNVGGKKGVKVGNPVMSPSGLVGHVISVGPNSSRALRLQDLNSRIAVMSKSGELRAIMSGDNSPSPQLTFVQDKDQWRDNLEIVTSGDDGMLPQGLPVGYLKRDNEGELQVTLSSSQTPIDWVWVSPFTPIIAPVQVATIDEETPQEDGE